MSGSTYLRETQSYFTSGPEAYKHSVWSWNLNIRRIILLGGGEGNVSDYRQIKSQCPNTRQK